jgi:hypothetical protein
MLQFLVDASTDDDSDDDGFQYTIKHQTQIDKTYEELCQKTQVGYLFCPPLMFLLFRT